MIDKSQGWVDGGPNSLQLEVRLECVDLVSVVCGSTDHLVDNTEQETFRLTQILLGFQVCCQND